MTEASYSLMYMGKDLFPLRRDLIKSVFDSSTMNTVKAIYKKTGLFITIVIRSLPLHQDRFILTMTELLPYSCYSPKVKSQVLSSATSTILQSCNRVKSQLFIVSQRYIVIYIMRFSNQTMVG